MTSRSSESRAATPRSQTYTSSPSADQSTDSAQGGNPQSVTQRSRWQSVLLEAGSISAAVSEESMRRLKYCLQWLQVSLPQSLQLMSIDFITVCYYAY